ncbi:MAG TPA: two-component system response regulator [Microbacteriaceae bacterium]|jgi:response regulator of citrate/malate metabolism|nr:two-component system response regulator [Microbacteriaceae bacterium]
MIRVLVLDDDFRVARIHAQFVNQTPGFLVVGTVHSGRDALAAVKELAPDLILLDVHLPDINGLDLLRRWRADGVSIGAIVITAAREAEPVRAALAGGATHYIIKPFEYEDLASALQHFQQQHDAVASLASASQDDIDRIFGHTPPPTESQSGSLPKGLSAETAQLVEAALRDAGQISATQCADLTGISRVTVRRYLEYFAQTGVAVIRLQYGRSGRPTRYYSLR